MLECISFASAAARGPEPRRTSIFVNNYVDFFFSPNRPYRPYLSHITDRPSLGWGLLYFLLTIMLKNFLAKPTLPSVLKSKTKTVRPLGGSTVAPYTFPVSRMFLKLQ
eukprot:UN23309